jgi:hypothetical protein
MLKAASEREQPYQEFPASANTHLARLSSKNFPSIKLSSAHEFSEPVKLSSAQQNFSSTKLSSAQEFLSRSSSAQLSKISHQLCFQAVEIYSLAKVVRGSLRCFEVNYRKPAQQK